MTLPGGLPQKHTFAAKLTTPLNVVQPAAAGSGIPEIIGFLNGTRIKDIFKVQTLIVKFLSCAFAVGCGMPVGYEGPMIHLGSLVAAGMSQFKSATFECSLPCFSRCVAVSLVQ